MVPLFTIGSPLPRADESSEDQPWFRIAGPVTAEVLRLRERLAEFERLPLPEKSEQKS